MNKNLVELVNKINSNPEYQRNLAQCKNKEELFKYCSSIYEGCTPKELDNLILGIASINKLKNNILKEGELEKINGGSGPINYSGIGTVNYFGNDSVNNIKDNGPVNYFEIGTVNQVSDKIDSLTNSLKPLATLVDVANKVVTKDIENMDRNELMQMATEILNDLGFY